MKKDIRFFLIIVLGCMLSVPLMAQETSSDAEKERTQLDQLGIINEDGTISSFTNNNGERLQWQEKRRNRHGQSYDQSDDSQVNIEQLGENNSSIWQHEGNNNTLNLKQDGGGNVHEGYLIGEDNVIQILQEGNSNRVIQDLAGDGMNIEVSQDGDNHEFIQIEKGGTSPAYQIHQQGNHGMNVKIEHERY